MSGRVVLEEVKFPQLCKIKLDRGSQSFLWQSESKQNGWENARCRLSGRPSEKSCETTDNASRCQAVGPFKQNDHHARSHVLGKIRKNKTRVQRTRRAFPCRVACRLLHSCEAIWQQGDTLASSVPPPAPSHRRGEEGGGRNPRRVLLRR